MHLDLWNKRDRIIAEHMHRSAELIASGVTPELPERIEFSPQLPPEAQARIEALQRYEEATKNLNVGTY